VTAQVRTERNCAALIVALVALLPPLGGCAPKAIKFTAEPKHIIVLPGILGHTFWLDRIRKHADADLPDTSAQVWDWTRIKPHIIPNPIAHIMQYKRNCFRAKELAAQITEFHRQHPNVELSIVALSGGVPMAIFALEDLPDDVKIKRLVLLSGAISPHHDLTKALSHVEGEIVNYYSHGDWFVLKRGTTRFGTGDRVFEPSAGYAGFDRAAACPHGCDQLVQIEWRKEFRKKYGNGGGHAGSLPHRFIRECVVQWLAGNVGACAAEADGPQHFSQ